MLPKSSVICKALPLRTWTQMFLEKISTRPFLLCSKQRSGKLPEKPCDISETDAVSQKFCEYPDLHSTRISTSLHTQWPNSVAQTLVTAGSVHPVLLSLCHSYPAGSELSMGLFPALHSSPIQPFPFAALLETHPTPEPTANPKWPVGDLVPCQHTKGSAHSLPASLMQIKMVPKFQPLSKHVTYFQKEEQYLGYCSAKNLN